MAHTMIISIVDDETGDSVNHEFPSKKEVCWDCEGEGTVLREGMREHAYTMSEFLEDFDDEEDRKAYFQRGGIYDVVCPTCKGSNVIDVVDEEQFTEEHKKLHEIHLKELEADAAFRAEQAAERRMGC